MQGMKAVMVLVLALVPASPWAQEARRPSGDTSARLQQQVQQLASERTALQTENARLKEQLARLEKEVKQSGAEKESLTRRAGAAEAKASRAEASNQSAGSRLEATEARLGEVVAKYRELAEQLRAVETERNELARQAATSGKAVLDCARKNVELAGIANESLDRYEKKGCFGALAQAEPFTRLKRVEVENIVEEFRQRIEAEQVPVPTAEGE